MNDKYAAHKLSAKWPSDWSVGVRVWFERRGKAVLEERSADVLMAVERTRSITGAARSLGISYRHAWLLIQAANESSGQALVDTAVGGKRGGGAQLTEYGRAAIVVFQKVQQQVREAAAKSLPRIVKFAKHETSTVHLAAAISLQEVVAHVLSEYALVRPTVTVRTIFGASNELAEQIAAGGHADVFISASHQHIRRLVQNGMVNRSTRCTLAGNGLAIVGDRSLAGKLRKPSDLRRLTVGPIVVADPACPLGACTAQFLIAAKLTELPRLQQVENSRAVVTAMRAPGPRVGIIFGSDVANAIGVTTLLQIPLKEANTEYEGAVLASSTVQGEAKNLLEFFRSKQAQSCFRRCGFSV